MDYTKSYTELKTVYNLNDKHIDLPGSGMKITNLEFKSDFLADDFHNSQDPMILENNSFIYPVFSPAAESNKMILLLHGLNERSWVKYLVWAQWLAYNTSSYVILFPISFHINRSPSAWMDPRSMVPYMHTRNSVIGNTSMLSFANVALSNRLTEDPMRFFNSGRQTAADLVKLFQTIRSGKHEIIPKGCTLNIFAYSIGAFLAEILMLSDPEGLFSESKLFIFCGGSVFSNMNGTSKLIMDSYAFERVYNFYLHSFENSLRDKNRTSVFLRSTAIGTAFRSMIDRGRLRSFRERRLRNIRDQIQCTVLKKDTVIPVDGVIQTLSATNRQGIVKVSDFPFSYSHENPFPLFTSSISDEVDRCFELTFSDAERFLR